jgi:hypothetical protein
MSREGDREVIDLQRGRGANVFPVLVGQRTGGQAAALPVDAFVVAEFSADEHTGIDARPIDAENLQADLPIVEQQHVARGHVGREFLVGDSDGALGAGIHCEARIQGELRAIGELHPTSQEALDADFRAREVAQNTDVASGLRGGIPHQIEAPRVVGGRAMREVDADHVHAGPDHVGQHLLIVRCRTQSCDDLGPTQLETHAARLSRTSTAGSFFPSTNSRNAPPPVEI